MKKIMFIIVMVLVSTMSFSQTYRGYIRTTSGDSIVYTDIRPWDDKVTFYSVDKVVTSLTTASISKAKSQLVDAGYIQISNNEIVYFYEYADFVISYEIETDVIDEFSGTRKIRMKPIIVGEPTIYPTTKKMSNYFTGSRFLFSCFVSKKTDTITDTTYTVSVSTSALLGCVGAPENKLSIKLVTGGFIILDDDIAKIDCTKNSSRYSTFILTQVDLNTLLTTPISMIRLQRSETYKDFTIDDNRLFINSLSVLRERAEN